jgi:hypothetical protein
MSIRKEWESHNSVVSEEGGRSALPRLLSVLGATALSDSHD